MKDRPGRGLRRVRAESVRAPKIMRVTSLIKGAGSCSLRKMGRSATDRRRRRVHRASWAGGRTGSNSPAGAGSSYPWRFRPAGRTRSATLWRSSRAPWRLGYARRSQRAKGREVPRPVAVSRRWGSFGCRTRCRMVAAPGRTIRGRGGTADRGGCHPQSRTTVSSRPFRVRPDPGGPIPDRLPQPRGGRGARARGRRGGR